MNPQPIPWFSGTVAVAGSAAILVVGGGAWLAGAILLLWLGTLWLGLPEPEFESRPATDGALTPQTMESLIEPIGLPLLLIDRERIMVANAAARAQFGKHLAGQDVRIALRHPEAVALLESGEDKSATVRGLTSPRSIWQVSRRPIGPRYALVELLNRTAEADISRAHTDFVANASHELRTPLASIIGYVETLADGDSAKIDKPTRLKFLSTALREARRLQSLVEDLMSLSRVEAEKHDRPDRLIDLAQLVPSVAREIAAIAGPERVVVELPESPAIIRGDRGQIDQLLRNLVDNALKYGRPDTPVTVRIHQTEGAVHLSVRDQGEGIGPEHLPHLTRRFYRTDPGRSRAGGGTGLGLAIVKHIVERHRGKLDIASTVGTGTTFSVRFERVVGE